MISEVTLNEQLPLTPLIQQETMSRKHKIRCGRPRKVRPYEKRETSENEFDPVTCVVPPLGFVTGGGTVESRPCQFGMDLKNFQIRKTATMEIRTIQRTEILRTQKMTKIRIVWT